MPRSTLLTLALLAVAACGPAPTESAPSAAPAGAAFDGSPPPADTTGRGGGTIGSGTMGDPPPPPPGDTTGRGGGTIGSGT